MTRRGLFLSYLLGPALASGCIVTKDMGEGETESDSDNASETGAVSMTSVSGDDAASMTSAADDGPVTTTAMSDDDATATGAGSDDDASATSSASDDGIETTTGDGGSGSSGTGSGDQADCEATGGTWEPTSCGHYGCGVPPACAAVIPGCDCGPTMNFVEGTGCVEDQACLQATFECGDIDCTLATEYCEVLHPGIPGPLTYSCNALPAACVADPTCTCLTDEDVVGPGTQCTELKAGGLQVDFFAP